MSKYKVLLTDFAWPDVEIERSILAEIDAELIVADQSDVDSLARLATDVHAIMTTWAQVPDKVIAAATGCQIVSRLGIGLDNIDVDYCTLHKIPVTNVPDYCLPEVAEHALALLLSMARKISLFHYETQSERYQLKTGPKLRRVENQTLGIVGFGNIGRKLAQKALGIGLRAIASDPVQQNPLENVPFVEFEELLTTSDYISLHVPLTDATQHLFSTKQFSLMKPTAYLINTARGGLIDHDALAVALDEQQLAGAGLDVQDPEPPDLSRPPFNDPRVIVTPHAAFMSEESLQDLRTRTTRQVATRLTGGRPENIVNPQVLD